MASVKKTTSETVNDPFVFWNSQQRSEGNILVALMSSRESKKEHTKSKQSAISCSRFVEELFYCSMKQLATFPPYFESMAVV